MYGQGREEEEEEKKKWALTFKVGERCETFVTKQPKRGGTINFRGIVP